MIRMHLFEFEDHTWFPRLLRGLMTDYLRRVVELFGLAKPVVPLLDRMLRETRRTSIIDLASGAGGPWPTIAPMLRSSHPALHVTMTDLFPADTTVATRLEAIDGIESYHREPVDARRVPGNLAGMRTQFLSLHHLKPDDVESVLRNAVQAGEPYAAFEFQERSVKQVIQFALSPLFVLLLTPTIRPITPARVMFTYLLPIVPIAILWDGIVSVLRTYTPDELKRLAASADPECRFKWQSGVERSGPGPVVYLIGAPQSI